MNNRYFTELDLLRGLAALSVFMSHATGIYQTEKSFLLSIFSDGHAAVILFFVLSGFVLTYNNLYSKSFNYKNFIIKRIFRIYPVFIVSILCALCLHEFFYDKNNLFLTSEWFQNIWSISINETLIVQTLFLVGPSYDHSAINPVIWTLIVEMYASFLLPIFVYVLRLKTPYHFVLLLILFIAPVVLNIPQLHFFLVFYIGSLYAKYFEIVNAYFINKLKLLFFISFVLYLYKIFSIYDFDNVIYLYNDYVITFGSLGLILFVTNSQSIIKFSSNSFSKFLGKTSYPFYLFHFPILLAMVSSLNNKFSLLEIIIMSYFLSSILSYLGHRFVEEIFITIGKSVVQRFNKVSLKMWGK